MTQYVVCQHKFVRLIMVLLRLKELRNQHGYTQQQLADYLGITSRSYQRYESGDCEPTLSTVIAIADFFDVTVDYLLGR